MLTPAVEPPPDQRRTGSRRRRSGAGLLLAVLLLGAAAAGADLLDRSPRREPGAADVVPPAFPGVRATSQLLVEDPLRVRLLV